MSYLDKYQITTCPECEKRLTWNLFGACASVGIEHGHTTLECVQATIDRYHERGHR